MSFQRRIIAFLSIVQLTLATTTLAADALRAPNWDRELALETSSLGGVESPLREWFAMLREGDHARLLLAVRDYSGSGTMTAPVRERQLYEFTLSLADFPAGAVPTYLLDFLAAYAPQTLVPHEEDIATAVPLFNIPAAALGVRNSRDRERAETRSMALLKAGPDTWVQSYLAGSVVERAGFIDALASASAQPLEAIGRLALQELGKEPALLPAAGAAALASADREGIERIVQIGRGAEVAAILRDVPGHLAAHGQALVLLYAISSAPAENGALSIALLAPGLHEFAAITDTLFELLEDAELGSAAALALARHPDPAVASRLEQLSSGEGSAAKRAHLALELVREGALGGTESTRSPVDGP